MAKQKKSFVPKARLIQILGEHLIKDATVGLLELIKNSYDADATNVEIVMADLHGTNPSITIRDNGTGMSEDAFLNRWMNPATGHKERTKESAKRTPLGRLPLGEKGVGRFAAQQMGDHLKMISKTADANVELVADIDWTQFEDYDKDLSEVEIEYENRESETFLPAESGTILEISRFKTNWSGDELERISNSLKRMKSPFKGANDFEVSLRFVNCPEAFEKFADLSLSDVLERSHYKLFGLIDDSGVMTFEYDVHLPGSEKIHRDGEIDLKTIGRKLDGPTTCGGFVINLHHYSKQQRILKASGINKQDIEQLSGVSVYRDGMRILPYGEAGNDWLRIDNERVQDTGFMGNDTVIGMVEINQSQNPALKDKTNREGLIENDAYRQFENLVFNVVKTLHTEKKLDQPPKEKRATKPGVEVAKKIEDAKKSISDLTQRFSKSSDSSVRALGTRLKQLDSDFEGIRVEIVETVSEFESSNKQLLNLAGTGLAAERFTHEFARLVSGANASLERLKKRVDLNDAKVKKEVDTIGSVLEALRNDIKLLGPMFYVKRVALEKVLDIRTIIDNTLLLQSNAISGEGIQVEIAGDTFAVKMREGSCMQIFNNLIDNSIYWLSRKSEGDDKLIRIILDKDGDSVYVSDNGPGVIPRYRERIFEPFMSMKGEEGRGLGLYIIREILEEKGWDVSLVDKAEIRGLLKGASFCVTFSEVGKKS